MKLEKPNISNRSGIIILSIQAVHAQRIFSGVKLFELRKSLPRIKFKRAYLYETGAGRIIGCFDVGRVLKLPPEELWAMVGERATTRERFNSYFLKNKTACAIEAVSPTKFFRPLLLTELRSKGVKFSPPVSSHAIRLGDKLAKLLEERRKQTLHAHRVELRQIRKSEETLYQRLVTQEIAHRYDEITPAFANCILKTNRRGFDPHGIFTEKKYVLAIINEHNTLVGFTTVTFKFGGSIKTGPTILLTRYRGRGIGSAVRMALDTYAESHKARKLYCTSPDTDFSVISYLLRAGYRIEAHLQQQYTKRNGELVFGKKLGHAVKHSTPIPSRIKRAGCVQVIAKTLDKTLLTAFREMFSRDWLEITDERAKAIVQAGISETQKSYEEKPVRLVGARTEDGVWLSFILLIPKRGGAIKAIFLTSTAHELTNTRMIQEAERYGSVLNKRKIYFCHPAQDTLIVSLLKDMGYFCEGLLNGPYRPNVDVLILSKNLYKIDANLRSPSTPTDVSHQSVEMMLPLGE